MEATEYTRMARTAYNEALAELRNRHLDELEALIGDKRQAHGLPRDRKSGSKTLSQNQILDRLERARAKVAKYEAMLNGA